MASDDESDHNTSAASEHVKDGRAKVVRRRSSAVKFKKAPEAPKNPKTAFFFFSIHMHDERKKGASEGQSISNKVRRSVLMHVDSLFDASISSLLFYFNHQISFQQLYCAHYLQVPDAARQISMAWKALSPEDKKKWEEMAEKDKLRYKVEKSIFTGQLTVVKGEKRAKKDSEAPKRPMSAFLDYSKTLRSQAIKDNPHVTDNKEISKILGSMWRNATDEEKQPFIDKELLLRDEYNEKTRQYKKEKHDRQVAERNDREAKVIEAIENGTCDELIQAAEKSKRIASLKAMQESTEIARESSSSYRVDHTYASQYQSESTSDQSFAAHYQPHASAHGSYEYEDNTAPLYPQQPSYMPQYQSVPGYNPPFMNTGTHSGSHNSYHTDQWLPDNHQYGAHATANVQHIQQHWAPNSNARAAYQRGAPNRYFPAPQYNTEWMTNVDTSSNWQYQPNVTGRNSSQMNMFSPLPNERNIPRGSLGNPLPVAPPAHVNNHNATFGFDQNRSMSQPRISPSVYPEGVGQQYASGFVPSPSEEKDYDPYFAKK